ncbi:MAG: DapH/DapD/GlmU-related protein [Candidatus Lokiarchaeota archaeon]
MEDSKKDYSQVDFISSSGVYKTPFTIIVLFQFFVGGIILMLANAWYINHLFFLLTGKFLYYTQFSPAWWEWLLLPLNIFGNIFLFSFSIIFSSVGIYKILNKINPPKEGVFLRGSKEWKYVHYRFWVSYFPIWLVRAFPFPWIDIIVYRMFGTKIGRKVVAYEGYIDPYFIEIGDHTMTSLNILIFSHLIYHDKIIIKKVKIGKNCIIGPHSIVNPGTIIDDEAILGANSYTSINQHLIGNLIHVGIPVSHKFPIQTVEESKQKVSKIDEDNSDINKKMQI